MEYRVSINITRSQKANTALEAAMAALESAVPTPSNTAPGRVTEDFARVVVTVTPYGAMPDVRRAPKPIY